MWPKRKIQLVVSSETADLKGVRALLKGVQLEFSEVEPTKEDRCQDFKEQHWLEMPLECTSPSPSEDLGPVTELAFWSEGSDDDFWRKRALARGIKQQSIQALIHNILEDEQIIRVSEPIVLIEGRPMLGHVLNEAGFEPSILWPTADGRWQCERRLGIHWLIPESWLEGLDEFSGNRGPSSLGDQATWVVRETRIDFYRAPEGREFVGHLPRWPELHEEHMACLNIAKCLDLGVSWRDIQLALNPLWSNKFTTDNLRWNINDFEWNGGSGGEELSTAPFDHVEDWWSC